MAVEWISDLAWRQENYQTNGSRQLLYPCIKVKMRDKFAYCARKSPGDELLLKQCYCYGNLNVTLRLGKEVRHQ